MPIEPGIELKKDEILRRISQEEIFERYLGLSVDEATQYTNPLRVDTNPGCKYYYNTEGKLRFKDFAKGTNWDCFSLVQHLHQDCSFIDALRIIVRDFKLNTEAIRYDKQYREIEIKPRREIKASTRLWESEDLAYWAQYNILADTLFTYNVYPAKGIWIDNDYYRVRKNDPCYIYYFYDDLYKLYFPKRKKGEKRFFTNVVYDDHLMQGYNRLPETGNILIYTKSYKDVMSLSTFGLNAIAPQTETELINLQLHEELTRRFTTIVSLVDNDNTGRNMGNRYSAIGVPTFVFPWTMEKDFSDNVKKYGDRYMRDLILKIRENEGI